MKRNTHRKPADKTSSVKNNKPLLMRSVSVVKRLRRMGADVRKADATKIAPLIFNLPRDRILLVVSQATLLLAPPQSSHKSTKAKCRTLDARSFPEPWLENEDYLKRQILTYIGNKRSLLKFITKGIQLVQKKLGKDKLDVFDVFSGSGVVARYFKQFSDNLFVNDLEKYSQITNECYLANTTDINLPELKSIHRYLLDTISTSSLVEGFITELYAPKNDDDIQAGERVFYTHRNAMYIDTMRQLIDSVDVPLQKFFLAPLLSQASVHSNTSGMFKGFHKNPKTGIGQFGGGHRDALLRIKGEIKLPFPVFSNFQCNSVIYNGDSNDVVKTAPEVDLAYLDPPYNQHPYGSNYFMLNLILENKRPESVSKISGIAEGWNRSAYNKKQFAYNALSDLVENIKAKYVLISFNSEGFVSLDEMKTMLAQVGKVDVLETNYNTFRGCRNFENRSIHVNEYLYLLEN